MTRVRIYDDPGSAVLRPLVWIRPASRLLLGAERTQERWERLFAPSGATVELVTRDMLASIGRARHSWTRTAPREGELWISDLVVPSAEFVAHAAALRPDQGMECEGALVAFRAGPRAARVAPSAKDPAALLASIAAELSSEVVSVPRLLGLADLLRYHESLLDSDLARLLGTLPAPESFGDAAVYRPKEIRLGPDCRLDQGAVLDARSGPIVLSAGCEVHPHTWIHGPFFAGPATRLLGGKIGAGSSIGPKCRVHGEVEATVMLGLTNKAHDGFVGHSYLGEWINLGALTTTSDLKNNYGAVRLEVDGKVLETGLKKVGSFLGDHVKTRIGCLLSTGTVVGLGANLFGDLTLVDRWVPEFAWGYGPDRSEYALDKFLETAEIVMGRREETLGEAERAALTAAFVATAGSRERS